MLFLAYQIDRKRERLDEEALQAYVCCRLRDRGVPAIPEPRRTIVFFDRETLAAKNTRNDLKVQAVSLNGSPLSVIIEVKWSDHPELSTAQAEQLAQQYLLDNDLTHGIYLVGWCGKAGPWRTCALGARPTDRSSLDAWRQALENQAHLLQELHPSLNVETFLLDLGWK